MNLHFENLHGASTSTLLPKGMYAFQVTAVDPQYESGEKGTKGLEVKATVIEGVDFDDGSSTQGLQRTIRFWYPTPSQKDGGKFCLGRLNEFLTACGQDTSNDEVETDNLVGACFVCRVKIKASDNGDQEEYEKFKPYVA